MNANKNWPHGTDLGSPNFTGKTLRTSKHNGSGWPDDSDKITPARFIAGVGVVGMFLAMMFVGSAAGF